MHVLRLSLRADRIQRTIGVGGVYSVMIVAVRSTTAGSGTVCDELRALLITVTDDIDQYNPFIDLVLIVYVDDITIMYERAMAEVVATVLANITDQLVKAIEDELQMEISPSKTFVNAFRLAIANRIAYLSKTIKLTPKRAGSCWALVQLEAADVAWPS